MLTPATHLYLRRGVILTAMILVVAPLSLKLGELYAARNAEAARQRRYEESRRAMEEQRGYLRAGTIFPDFALLNADDSSTTSLHEQLAGGGMMILISPDCPSCDAIIEPVRSAIEQIKHARRICIVADSPLEHLRGWSAQHGLALPCFQDRDRFIGANYDYTIIPFLVLLNERFEIVDYSTGGWLQDDYVRLLTPP